jgi:hypothetical protein
VLRVHCTQCQVVIPPGETVTGTASGRVQLMVRSFDDPVLFSDFVDELRYPKVTTEALCKECVGDDGQGRL